MPDESAARLIKGQHLRLSTETKEIARVKMNAGLVGGLLQPLFLFENLLLQQAVFIRNYSPAAC
jgi:hypothetical protein